ncbi:hypothetical protein EWM64_g4368 [Hericium alpestre]|uniref:Uncharacterized protein n=1 Tax=Hericium alpestre TaxID=135208 RepID=A0A4Y9ZXW4_9AGAM|nr:hypothetical protein EWM64_g4368 [Hericium alpestre]
MTHILRYGNVMVTLDGGLVSSLSHNCKNGVAVEVKRGRAVTHDAIVILE